jgi:CheY-like chemotaxis protein
MKLISSLLIKNGYEVETASTGKDALSILESDGFVDIIVTDIRMPVMSGFHLLAYLKTESKFARIPVIICSALSDAEYVTKGISLGAVDYLTKPVDAKILLTKVRKAEQMVPGAVLVVDDEELLRDLLTRILQRNGLRVLTAANGEEALEVLEANKVSVVVSDVAMPQMDGLKLLAKVKESNPDLPVLLVTGQTGKHSRDQAEAAGADGYVAKPFKSTEILQSIAPLIK